VSNTRLVSSLSRRVFSVRLAPYGRALNGRAGVEVRPGVSARWRPRLGPRGLARVSGCRQDGDVREQQGLGVLG
jgi:hypothetical protein